MTFERWEQLKENLKGKFSVLDHQTQDLIMETGKGLVKAGLEESLVVKSPIGKIKLVCEIKPKVLEKKLHYTHQQGQSATAEYKFSQTEKICRLRLFKWNDEEYDWEELDESAVASIT
jgi:hypothetical protein